jgi:hypothetical protein
MFAISNSVGILSGFHATLIFFLVTMYGRTVVGLGNDLAFASLFLNWSSKVSRIFNILVEFVFFYGPGCHRESKSYIPIWIKRII